jgi:hypothetical protein
MRAVAAVSLGLTLREPPVRARSALESGVCGLVARERRATHVAGVLRSHVSSCVALNPHPTREAMRDAGFRSPRPSSEDVSGTNTAS